VVNRLADPATPALRAQISFRRGDFRLEARFSVHAGEVLAVLGPNGAGKTTLLRILAGLLAVTEGRVEITDQLWDDAGTGQFVPAAERSVGLVFQDYRLFPHLSVLDNVAFAARARGTRRGPARIAAQAQLDRLGLADLAGRRPGQLSGGQAQRVALARALAMQPRMLLLDEPLAALDARTRLDLRTRLRRQLTAFPGPSIVVTHDPLEALVLADRILVLEGGRIVQEGPPAEVARRPATEYVARLMGLNLYPGVLVDPAAGKVALDAGGVLFAAGHVGGEPAAASGTPMLVVLAPAAIALHLNRPGPGSSRNVWTGVVSGVELLTDRVRVAVVGQPAHLDQPGQPGALVDVTPAAVAELGLEAGQQIWLSAKATEVIAYPAVPERHGHPDG
jgi:molybdate transport system ATP-binding protein